MIDKLEFRLSGRTSFHPDVREFMLEGQRFRESGRLVPSKRYEWVTDLRPVGRDAILHFSLKRPENDSHAGEHKLELIDTGQKSYSDLVALLEQTIQCAIDDLEIMRIDLCADVVGVPVEWFLNRVRVKYKRHGHEIGETKFQLMGGNGIQTILFGKRPNPVRIYDKVAECNMQLQKMKRRQSREADDLSLYSEFGIADDAVITRVERQFGGKGVPAELPTFGSLHVLPEFDPFTNIEIVNGTGAKVPTVGTCGFDAWLVGTRLHQLHEQMGEQQFRRFLHKNSKGNAARYRKHYADFIGLEASDLMTSRTLFDTYRESVTRQLAA